jgi:segregation and condensation protein B
MARISFRAVKMSEVKSETNKIENETKELASKVEVVAEVTAETAGVVAAPSEAVASEAAPSEEAEADSQPVERPEVPVEDLPKLFEALLFVAGNPLPFDKLCEISKTTEEIAKEALAKLKTTLEERQSAFALVEINGSYQFRTKEFFAPFIQELKRTRPKRLSPAALETLAVVAYRQPVVKSDIEAIRGVDVAPTLKTLIDRKLIRILGYQATVGQPALYGTTEQFLEIFGMKSLSDLPSLRDLREFAEEPGESSEVAEEASAVVEAGAQNEQSATQ